MFPSFSCLFFTCNRMVVLGFYASRLVQEGPGVLQHWNFVGVSWDFELYHLFPLSARWFVRFSIVRLQGFVVGTCPTAFLTYCSIVWCEGVVSQDPGGESLSFSWFSPLPPMQVPCQLIHVFQHPCKQLKRVPQLPVTPLATSRGFVPKFYALGG